MPTNIQKKASKSTADRNVVNLIYILLPVSWYPNDLMADSVLERINDKALEAANIKKSFAVIVVAT